MQTELNNLGYYAVKSEDNTGLVFIPKDVPYEDRFDHIEITINGSDFNQFMHDNDGGVRKLQFIKEKINARIFQKMSKLS